MSIIEWQSQKLSFTKDNYFKSNSVSKIQSSRAVKGKHRDNRTLK